MKTLNLKILYFLMNLWYVCDAPKSGGPLITHQPTESLWISCNSIPHRCVPFTGIHNLTKIEQSLLCTGSSIQNSTHTIYNHMTHLRPNIKHRVHSLVNIDHIRSIYPHSCKNMQDYIKTIHMSSITTLLHENIMFNSTHLHINLYQMDLLQKFWKNNHKAMAFFTLVALLRPWMRAAHWRLSRT